jgi:hypothetical protein
MPAGTLPGAYGTSSVLDTLAANFQTVAQIGEDTVWDQLSLALAAHNRIVNSLLADFCQPTTDRLRRYGVAAQMQMDELDEHATPDAQKIPGGVVVGFPLKKYGSALQWTRTYFQKAKGSEIAAKMTGMLDADAFNLMRQIKKCLFRPTNYTFIDRLVDNLNVIPLPVKAFVNADGAGMPVGPNGETFDGSTHTHYLTCTTPGTLTDADLTSGLNTVLEHYSSGQAMIYVNQAQEATVRGFTPNFQQMYDNSLTIGGNVTYAKGPLDAIQIYNRRIGTYRGAEVWVKPWMPAGYVFIFVKGAPKPICLRYDPDLPSNLTMVFEDELHPLRARAYERHVGFGVWNRTNGALIDITNASYTQPSFT